MHVNAFQNFVNNQVYFEAYTPTKPSPFPSTSDDVDELMDGYTFRYGSYIYVVDECTVYMWDGTTFVKQEKGD